MKKFLAIICLFFLTMNVCFAHTVVFNVKTYKIHKTSCPAAAKCTSNCIKIEKKEAVSRGGIPCQRCGG